MLTKRNYDVVVVGAGPAGSCAALKLAEEGVNVLLIDKSKLPRYKTCGGGIVQRAINYLPFDISPVVERKYSAVEVNLLSSNQKFRTSRDQPIISMTMRDSFDYFLVSQAEKAGAKIIPECKIMDIKPNSDSVILETQKYTFKTNFIIAADGALSYVAKKGGWKETRSLVPALESEVYVDDNTLERLSKIARFDFDLITDGYAWVFPKRDHLSIGVLSMNKGKNNFTEYFNRYLTILGITSAKKVQRHGFVVPISPRKDELMKGRILLVGDAAGFADPITAEGISFAILSGQIAASTLLDGDFKRDFVKNIFDNQINNFILKELKVGSFFRQIIYNYPMIRTNFFRFYGHKITKAMTQVFMGENSYIEIIKNPLNYIKLIRVWNPPNKNLETNL